MLNAGVITEYTNYDRMTSGGDDAAWGQIERPPQFAFSEKD